MIRLPQPTTQSTLLSWAFQLISALDQQSVSDSLAQTSSAKTTQENAEAVSWFNA
jgi:hypothetical protein|tara:strand:- start:396 stop:560 length:165 start_codon:yes stop_codon:yes gene_type:complete